MSESARSGNAHGQTIRTDPRHQHPLFRSLSISRTGNNDHALSCRLPTFPKPSTASDRLDLHTVSNGPGLGRRHQPPFDDQSQHLEASRHIFSSQCIRTGIRLLKPMQTGFFSQRQGWQSPIGRRPSQQNHLRALTASLTICFFQNTTMVELSGIEPLTPCLQSRCSPS